MPHFAIPADDPVHIILFNIGGIKYPGIVRMDKIPDIFSQRLERPFPRHCRAEDGVELVGKLEAVFLRMIFPGSKMSQFRRQ